MPVEGPVERADVYKAGTLAGKLTRERTGVRFAYTSSYAASDLPAVATTLPRGAEDIVTPPGAVPPYFAGLLPEGRRLTALRQSLKVSADDELSLLCAVGTDTIGDVQVVPEGDDPHAISPAVDLEPGGAYDFSRLVDTLMPLDRVGIPGIQDKVSGRMIAVPADEAGRRYILKLNPPEYPHVVENEAMMIELARECRVPVVDARLVHDVHGIAGLLVTRFDRHSTAEGMTVSRAVEDGCQLMDRWPADKYSVSTENLAQSVIALCAAGAVAARDVFRQLAFAILTGNGDLHAKNLSIVTEPTGEWRVAPAYDIPCTALYGDRTLALPIAGRRSGISRRILLDFAEAIGLRRTAASRWLDELVDGTAGLTERVGRFADMLPSDAVRRATREITNRRRLLTEGR